MLCHYEEITLPKRGSCRLLYPSLHDVFAYIENNFILQLYLYCENFSHIFML